MQRRLRLPGLGSKKSSPAPAPAPIAPKGLKTYVWTGVLCDYTYGVAVAVAESMDAAYALLACEYAEHYGTTVVRAQEHIRQELPEGKCEVYPAGHPVAVVCSGGG